MQVKYEMERSIFTIHRSLCRWKKYGLVRREKRELDKSMFGFEYCCPESTVPMYVTFELCNHKLLPADISAREQDVSGWIFS